MIYVSYYNITGNFAAGDIRLEANGSTLQEGGSGGDQRSSGNLWSMGGRQIRAVKEK